MAIIELLARTPEGLNLTQISDSLGKSKAEIFRMVAVQMISTTLSFSN